MKTLITILALLLLANQAFSQRGSKEDPKPDARDAKIDSLTKSNKMLTLQVDSITGELVKYMNVYNTVKEKVIHYNFDPTRSSYLIDSLKAARDSTALLAALPKSKMSADSISMLLHQTSLLKSKADSIRNAWQKFRESISAVDLEQTKAINSLKQLKELYDSKTISEAEFVMLRKKYLEKL